MHLSVIRDYDHDQWEPLAPKGQVPSLLDESGHFYVYGRRAEMLKRARLDEVEVEFRAQGSRGTLVVRGAREVAPRARAGAGPRPGALTHPVLVDGVPGVLVTVDGRPVTIMASPLDRPKLRLRNISRPPRLQASSSALSRITAVAVPAPAMARRWRTWKISIF